MSESEPVDQETHESEPAPLVRRTGKRRMMRLLQFVAVFYAVWLAMLYFLQERMIFPGMVMRTPSAEGAPPDAEVLWIEPRPGTRVEAWLLSPPSASAERPAELVVFTHGNAELIDDLPWMLRPYLNLGYHVLLPEYRGFGRSAGTPGERAIVADVLAFIEQARARPEVDERLVLHGRSIGGAVSVQAAVRVEGLTALVLESTPAGLAGMAWRYGAPPLLLRHRFDTLSAAKKLSVPALVMHGRDDQIVPFAHAKQVSRVLGTQLVVYECGHNDLPPDPEDYWRRIGELLGRN